MGWRCRVVDRKGLTLTLSDHDRDNQEGFVLRVDPISGAGGASRVRGIHEATVQMTGRRRISPGDGAGQEYVGRHTRYGSHRRQLSRQPTMKEWTCAVGVPVPPDTS